MDRMDIDNILPASTSILIDKIEYHTNGPQPVEDNVDINGYSRSKYPNPYTPLLDKYKLKWAFRLVKHVISKKAIDDLRH